MKKLFATLGLALLATACTDTTGLSPESSRPVKGNADAAVVVMEFADLQCPACKAAHEQVTGQLVEKYGNQIRFEFKHFPLRTIHPYALEAALGAECAADQGKFWEYVDANFAQQDELNIEAIHSRGAELGLDVPLYERCVKSQIKRDTVLADYDEGRELGVQGTPTFFVNGQQTPATVEGLSAAIDAQLQAFQQRL